MVDFQCNVVSFAGVFDKAPARTRAPPAIPKSLSQFPAMAPGCAEKRGIHVSKSNTRIMIPSRAAANRA
jgi:hypothetical protein